MDASDIYRCYEKIKHGESVYQSLMRKRVRSVLLVASPYDAYIMERAGSLGELLYSEYRTLDLSQTPEVMTEPRPEKVIPLLADRRFDLVILTMRLGTQSPLDLCADIRRLYPMIPVILLLNRRTQLASVTRNPALMRSFSDVYLWQGNSLLFVAMIKTLEDRRNCGADTRRGLVRSLLHADDSISGRSLVLPLIYKEIMRQTREQIASEPDEFRRRLQMRSRPKVLSVRDFARAAKDVAIFSDTLIAAILRVPSDPEKLESWMTLVNAVRDKRPDLPLVFLSGHGVPLWNDFGDNPYNPGNDPALSRRLERFLGENLGYGPFVFRMPDGRTVARAETIYGFEQCLADIPAESLEYHARRNHFSAWLIAHGHLNVAREVRRLTPADFESSDMMRIYLVNAMKTAGAGQYRGSIVDFDIRSPHCDRTVVRLTEGSLGGKGRGLAFLNSLLAALDVGERFPTAEIRIPATAIVGTSEFDEFLQRNKLRHAYVGADDITIQRRFIAGALSPDLDRRLREYLRETTAPLAVRSSGLLEDSQSQPFAGVYKTWMIPNNHPDPEVRFKQLSDAVKACLANPFLDQPRRYIESIHYKLDEEKMAVVIQEVVGSESAEHRFFPHFSGVAQSYNFYPAFLKHSDGIAILALGLGKTVVDGNPAFRFCPRYPQIDLVKPLEVVENNQRSFYAVNLDNQTFDISQGEDVTLDHIRITASHKQGVFKPLTSVWDYDNLRFIDGDWAEGPRVVTFRNLTHYGRFPLADIMQFILVAGELATGAPVEIEYAVNLQPAGGGKPVFYLLQIRPLTMHRGEVRIDPTQVDKKSLLLLTTAGMGNGVIDNLTDIVFVDPDLFDNTRTVDIQSELQQINAILKEQGRKYILLGPGRWGTSDRFLGIPVQWTQIDQAKVIVEVGLRSFRIEPSQGSHFFHNLVAMNIGYFSVPYNTGNDFIDWEWLRNQPNQRQLTYVRHVRLTSPAVVSMDGRRGLAIIAKPNTRTSGSSG